MALDTKPTTVPARPAATAPSEIDLLRTQVAELKAILESVAPSAVAGVARGKRAAPVYARQAWEEDVIVEALQEGYYPEPHDTYAICRKGPQDMTDQMGNPVKTRGAIFRLAHREHLSAWMREVDPKDPVLAMVPVRRIPQTAARSQQSKVLSPFPPVQ